MGAGAGADILVDTPVPAEAAPPAGVPTIQNRYHGFVVVTACHADRDWTFTAMLPGGPREFAKLGLAVAACRAAATKGGEA